MIITTNKGVAMRKSLSSITLVAVIMLLTVGTIWSAGDKNTEYLMRVGDYFEVSYEDVDIIASGNIEIEDVPIVFYMAQLSKKSPADVLAIFEGGTSWSAFMTYHRIHPSEVLVKIYNFETPECQAIRNKMKNRPLKSVKFDNQDIRVMVNYKIIAETMNIKYADIINKRDDTKGTKKTFVEINHQSVDQSELAQSESNK